MLFAEPNREWLHQNLVVCKDRQLHFVSAGVERRSLTSILTWWLTG